MCLCKISIQLYANWFLKCVKWNQTAAEAQQQNISAALLNSKTKIKVFSKSGHIQFVKYLL